MQTIHCYSCCRPSTGKKLNKCPLCGAEGHLFNRDIKIKYTTNQPCKTPDGMGKIIGVDARKCSNGGPGARQFVVQLEDGRKRHYTPNEVQFL